MNAEKRERKTRKREKTEYEHAPRGRVWEVALFHAAVLRVAAASAPKALRDVSAAAARARPPQHHCHRLRVESHGGEVELRGEREGKQKNRSKRIESKQKNI